MKKKNILKLSLSVLLTVFLTPVYSQTQASNIQVLTERFVRHGSRVSVSMDIVIPEGMNVGSNDMLILTPVLKSNENNMDYLNLPPVAITGGLRNKIINRKNKLGGDLPFDTQPEIILKRKNKTEQSINYGVSVPYKSWMDDALLAIETNVSGCANCSEPTDNQLIVQNILPKKDPELYKLTFIVPEVEPVKARNDRHTATFNYIVDRYELLRDYKNNSREFAQVDSVIGEIRDNKDLEITEFSIAGYASPEGGFEHNRKLAENRANSFANYLVTKFGIPRNKFTVDGIGEDWPGLRKAVAASALTDKQAILDIIDNVSNPDARDGRLLTLSGGDTYRILLNNYYPVLRRTEYSVAYVVRAFNVEEARQIIKTNPKLLSLNEIYLVAESYSSDSKEFREVFDIAVRLYPESEIAIMNSAAADIESKNLDTAIERLKKIENKPQSWNNLGVAYILKGDVEKALKYFTKSADSKDPDGMANLEIVEKSTGAKR
ncbi:OmpA family protein [Dysgonomonas termitidis]|uniref:OmpA family protein n=1 Tax=Dysgonomonas termitidis TaxID=1516126 RepID=A0ABV9KUC7_9BACT